MPRARIENHAGPNTPPNTRPCDHPGCVSSGEYRAPRSRASLNAYYWFCLDHVRTYNASWNYYAGMSAREIESEVRRDTVWQRPSWPFGTRVGGGWRHQFQDFGLFDLDEETGPEARRQQQANGRGKRPLTEQEQALVVFDLEPPFTLGGLKTRYKELVKLHHPDAHGGDKAAEERLKIINLAYSTLKASYFP